MKETIEIELRKEMSTDYLLIPLMDISAEARLIAVAWVEGYERQGMDIPGKQKLASDIMNYARRNPPVHLVEQFFKLNRAVKSLFTEKANDVEEKGPLAHYAWDHLATIMYESEKVLENYNSMINPNSNDNVEDLA